MCSIHRRMVSFFNLDDSEFQKRAHYQLSSQLSQHGITSHIKIYPAPDDERAWRDLVSTDPTYVGGRGGVIFLVTHGNLLLNVFRNSVTKMDYLRENKERLAGVIDFTYSYLDSTREGFRERQVYAS